MRIVTDTDGHDTQKRICCQPPHSTKPLNGDFGITSVTASGLEPGVPARLVLSANRPNPFRESTAIRFGLPVAQPVALDVYDVQGRRVVRLLDGVQPAGWHRVVWDGRDASGGRVTAGVYFTRLRVGTTSIHRKLLVIR